MTEQKLLLKEKNGLLFACSPVLSARGLNHVFTARTGGEGKVGRGGLNMAFHVGDDPQLVLANRKKVCAALDLNFDRLTAARQVHGERITVVDESIAGNGRADFTGALADTDALVTALPGVPLMLCYADCVPVTLADPVNKAAAVIHAGWRGTAASITRKTVEKMSALFNCRPQDCLAVIGPSIGGCCYEIGVDVKRSFACLPGCDEFLRPQGGEKWRLDLKKANLYQLLSAGLRRENIVTGDICTACDNTNFFSHRAEAGKTGRFAALVWL